MAFYALRHGALPVIYGSQYGTEIEPTTNRLREMQKTKKKKNELWTCGETKRVLNKWYRASCEVRRKYMQADAF